MKIGLINLSRQENIKLIKNKSIELKRLVVPKEFYHQNRFQKIVLAAELPFLLMQSHS